MCVRPAHLAPPCHCPPLLPAQDLKECLTKLGGLAAEDIIAGELLWTPQGDESYSKDELLTDYPGLVNL